MSQQSFVPQILRDRDGEEGVPGRVRDWWARLHGREDIAGQPYPSGVRAVLRRSTGADEALLTEGFRHLWFELPATRRTQWDMRAWAGVALVLAEVDEHVPDQVFASAMAQERKPPGSRAPRVSELRFQQLLRSRDLDEFIRRARRTVHLIGGKADVRSVADDILLWHREKNGRFATRPDHRLAVRWADAYFTQLAKTEPSNRAS